MYLLYMWGTKMKFYSYLLLLLISVIPAWAHAEDANEEELLKRNNKEIDAQLQNMKDMLPLEIQNGIRWIDVKRLNKEIQYTYIVNVNSADWNDEERMVMMSSLQDFGCRQLLPAMCEGSQVIFASGFSAVTTYHDSFGNYLFDCSFTPEICSSWENPVE